jgi:hypothetical protein
MQAADREIQIALADSPEWTETDVNRVLVWVALDKPVKVLEFWGSSQGAHWDGYVILQKDKGKLKRATAMEGVFSTGRRMIEVRETEEYEFESSGEEIKTVKHEFHPMTADRLRLYGLP